MMKALNSTNCFPFDYSKNNKKKTHFPLEKILQLKFYQNFFASSLNVCGPKPSHKGRDDEKNRKSSSF